MGYYDADGFYFHEESDIADPGAGFSELLNLPTEALPAAIRTRVVTELADDSTPADAAAAAVADAIAAADLVTETESSAAIADAVAELVTNSDPRLPRECVHLESGVWVWDGPDSPTATHYLLPDHTGALVARPTPFPTPSATAPELTW